MLRLGFSVQYMCHVLYVTSHFAFHYEHMCNMFPHTFYKHEVQVVIGILAIIAGEQVARCIEQAIFKPRLCGPVHRLMAPMWRSQAAATIDRWYACVPRKKELAHMHAYILQGILQYSI
jgi:hypothetical protein